MITSYGAPDTHEPADTWRDSAACRDLTPADANIFFAHYPFDIAYAKSICSRCPVIGQCRYDALEREEPWGVWGGLDRDDRNRELKRRGRAALAGTEDAAPKPQAWHPSPDCGTSEAYRKHIVRGEAVDTVCFNARTQADRQWDQWYRKSKVSTA